MRGAWKFAGLGLAIWVLCFVLVVSFGDFFTQDAAFGEQGAPESGQILSVIARSALIVAGVLAVAGIGAAGVAVSGGRRLDRGVFSTVMPVAAGTALILAAPLPAHWSRGCPSNRGYEHGAVIPAAVAPVVVVARRAPVRYFNLADRPIGCPGP